MEVQKERDARKKGTTYHRAWGEILAQREQNTSPGGGKDCGHRSTGTYRSNACPRRRVHPILTVSALTFLLHVEVPFHGVGADGLVLEGVFLHLLHQRFHFRSGSFEAVSCLERRNFAQRLKCREKKMKSLNNSEYRPTQKA